MQVVWILLKGTKDKVMLEVRTTFLIKEEKDKDTTFSTSNRLSCHLQ